MDASRLEELRRATRAAAASLARETADAGRRGPRAAPGDVFLSPADPASPFEWAVLERRSDSVRAVPADTRPLVGSHDVAIPAGTPGGALVLRCGLACWLPAERLEGARRSAVLAPPELRRALGRCREIELLGEAVAPADADSDPEYREWEEEAAAAAELVKAGARRVGRPATVRRWALAAAALIVANVGAGLVWLAARSGGGPPRPAVAEPNVPFVWLVPQERFRGEATATAPMDRPLVLILEVPALGATREYRLTVLDDGGRDLWSLAGLRRTGAAELSLLLPPGLLEPGTYRLRVDDAARPEAPPLAEFRLRLEEDSGPPGSP